MGTPPSAVTSQVSCMYRHCSPSGAIAWGCIEKHHVLPQLDVDALADRGNSIMVIPIECPVTWPRW